MKELDSPIIGALTLNYLSYGLLTAANNLWTWLTVVTAAVGFWRGRALQSPPSSRPEECGGCEDAASSSSTAAASASPSAAEPEVNQMTKRFPSPISPMTPSCEAESGGSPKVKFSVYYEEDGRVEIEESGAYECGGAAAAREELGHRRRHRLSDEWERSLAVRMGDLGWHTCQDLTVLNGSVVKLWDTASFGSRRF